ncbi:hypothetical protein BKP35_13410 [Anaerobacillus arseniciselenatis]|uniref:Uncharacterized protein n=1 Tax=Anaerobacillus arseniciselenatis TaxID=85682 RepID=A0A1S2LC77_9BACI|nr:hypothetical protein [Anaerobacillus arseniciselenatis]OIJ10109.1 hypothetical protein BKP35_13410 [Anaerobacillus arseniciselenatis]
MGIPTLPKQRHRPNFDETMIDLMESIAKEELALSQLIASESNKIKAFVGRELDFPTCPTTTEILNFNYSVNKLMDTVLMKEWLLLKKLETVSHMKSTFKLQNECKDAFRDDCCADCEDHVTCSDEEDHCSCTDHEVVEEDQCSCTDLEMDVEDQCDENCSCEDLDADVGGDDRE